LIKRILYLGVSTTCLWLTACASVPYTNRHQLILISPGKEDEMGLQAFTDVKTKSKISKDPAANALVRRVGERIAKAADRPERFRP